MPDDLTSTAPNGPAPTDRPTRAEHVAFCKQRAHRELDYYLQHEPESAYRNAFASIGSDLNKHPETRDHPGIMLGMQMLMIGALDSPQAMRRFIDGFN